MFDGDLDPRSLIGFLERNSWTGLGIPAARTPVSKAVGAARCSPVAPHLVWVAVDLCVGTFG